MLRKLVQQITHHGWTKTLAKQVGQRHKQITNTYTNLASIQSTDAATQNQDKQSTTAITTAG